MRHELETLERLLAQHGESGPAQMSRAALDGTDQKLRACLASNELWGDAGAAQKVIQSVARKVIHPKAAPRSLLSREVGNDAAEFVEGLASSPYSFVGSRAASLRTD